MGKNKGKKKVEEPPLPNIRDREYSGDNFRMYSFKIKTCPWHRYNHIQRECPYAHRGEKACRRDPKQYRYGCVPCPDFKQGDCKLEDKCENAHGPFERGLHPAYYRTMMCNEIGRCSKPVCFHAHSEKQRREPYVSTGSSAVPSPVTFPAAPRILPRPAAARASTSSSVWHHLRLPTLHSDNTLSRLSVVEWPLLSGATPRNNPSDTAAASSSQSPSNVSNMDDQFSESARLGDPVVASSVPSPHRSAVGSQLQHRRSLQSQTNTSTVSPRNVELQAPVGVSSTSVLLTSSDTESLLRAGPSLRAGTWRGSFWANWGGFPNQNVDDQASPARSLDEAQNDEETDIHEYYLFPPPNQEASSSGTKADD